MKCIQLSNNEVKRVSNQRAAEMTKKGAKYCTKAIWKAAPDTTWQKANVPANPTGEHKLHQQEMRILARTPKDGSRRSKERMKKGV